MKKNIIIIIILSVLLQLKATGTSINFNIKTEKEYYNLGEIVLLKFSLINDSLDSIYFFDDFPESLNIKDSKGNIVKPIISLLKIENTGKYIEPGKAWHNIVDISNEWFNLNEGTNSIQYNIRIKNMGKDEKISSNIIKLKIIKTSGETNDIYNSIKINDDGLGVNHSSKEYIQRYKTLLETTDKTNILYKTLQVKYIRSLGLGGKLDNKKAYLYAQEIIEDNKNNITGEFVIILYECILNNEGYDREEIVNELQKLKNKYNNYPISSFINYRINLIQRKLSQVMKETIDLRKKSKQYREKRK